MLRLLVAIGLAVSLSFSLPLSLSCEAGTHTFTKVFLSSVKSLHNIFPIRIGNIKIGFSGEDYKSIGDNPVCICKDPFIRVGIKVSLWEPHALVEPVKIPWCTPSLPIPGGLTNSLSFNRFALGSDNLQHGNIELRSAQVHYYRFTPLSLLGLLLDFVCLEKSGFDLSYFTEVDPLWQDDRLASVVNPEAFLFANPLAQFACSVDAGASSVGFPLDALYWCMGSFGSFFPLSQNIQLDSVQASAGLSSRLLFKLHRELMLWGYVGGSRSMRTLSNAYNEKIPV